MITQTMPRIVPMASHNQASLRVAFGDADWRREDVQRSAAQTLATSVMNAFDVDASARAGAFPQQRPNRSPASVGAGARGHHAAATPQEQPFSALEQLDSYWRSGAKALANNRWACPTVLDVLDDQEEGDGEGEQTGEDVADSENSLNCNAEYSRMGAWTASSVVDCGTERGVVTYRLRLGLPAEIAAQLLTEIPQLDSEAVFKRLPWFMEFVGVFFCEGFGKGRAVATSEGTTLTFSNPEQSVRLVAEFTPNACCEPDLHSPLPHSPWKS
jgi:hypothetical protein